MHNRRRITVDYENLSLEELHAKLEETAEAQAAIAKLVAQRKEQAKGELAQEIRELIIERGYAVEDIAELLQKGRRRKKADAQGKGTGRYACYVDPENPENIYKRGPLPKWFRAKMEEKGFDPNSTEDRTTFKQTHLKLQAAW
jgi:DNA-binding protein H-NS